MDNRNLEAVPLDPEAVDGDIGANPVLTLIATEDGIPTSTEVTVLTTTLGDIPLMTTLGQIAEVSLVPSTSTHPTFVTSHPGALRSVYATPVAPQAHPASDIGQVLFSEDGRITVVDADGIQRTLVLHTADHISSGLSTVDVQASAEPSSHEVLPRIVSIQGVASSTETMQVSTISHHVIAAPAVPPLPVIADQTREKQHQQVLEEMDVVPTPTEETESTNLLVSAVLDDVISRSQQQRQKRTITTTLIPVLKSKEKKAEITWVEKTEIATPKDKPKTQHDNKKKTSLSTNKLETILPVPIITEAPNNENLPSTNVIPTQLEATPDQPSSAMPESEKNAETSTEITEQPIPEEVVCLVCYQAFLNPKRNKVEKMPKSGIDDNSSTKDSPENSSLMIDPETKQKEENCENSYGRTLGNFFELSRVPMSILVRRSYKDYEVPICESCNKTLSDAEKIIKELKRLEKELYFRRQTIKDEIMKSYHFFRMDEENKKLAESRKSIAGLNEILEIVDRIREDIINDGRPPKIPSLSTGKKRGRKPKSSGELITGDVVSEDKTKLTGEPSATEATDSIDASTDKNADVAKANDPLANTDTEHSKKSEDEEEEEMDVKPAMRTSFGRIIKRPAYMMMNEMTADELSELEESSEDNYEEIEIKPDLPAELDSVDNVANPEGGLEKAVEFDYMEADDEDPAWYPGQEMIISDEIGLPASSSDESEDVSDDDFGLDGSSKVKVRKVQRTRKDPKEKRGRKPVQKFNKRKNKKKEQSESDLKYEVKVIQLDGTELMTINTSGANQSIGLEPAITQKVMDSQAVIMVKNQLFGKRVQCNYCPKSFTDLGRRDVHMKKKHEGESKPFGCEVCHKRFGRQDHLRNHMKRHMRPTREKLFKAKPAAPTEKSHKCNFCDQRFRNKSELAVHTRTHTGERPYKCDHCSEGFVSALKREFHIEQMHPEVPPIRCEFCPRGFFRQHRLRIHAVSHTGEKTNICEICGKSFSQAAMLRYHQTTHEELNLKQFKCQQCNRVFANPQNLKSHMESQHQKMYRHKCDTCGRGYTQMSHLRRHLRTHSGEQPYSCSYCPKKFTSGAALKIHVRIHTGERPYWCSQCEKGFRSKTKLGRHMKTLIHAGGDTTKVKREIMPVIVNTSTAGGSIIEIGGVNANEGTTNTASSSAPPQAEWTQIVGIITGV